MPPLLSGHPYGVTSGITMWRYAFVDVPPDWGEKQLIFKEASS
jgi:hypothetical protein